MRAVFYGTPQFAVPSLEALHGVAEVLAVICQPDKPRGRGLAMAEPPVKVRASQLGLPVWQPTKLRDGELAARLRALALDVALVVAYGRILPPDVLAAPRVGSLNVHASLLPKYRGAAPITWAIVRGESETGVTLMQMDAGMDTGPMLREERIAIGPNETQGELSERLAALGASMVTRHLAAAVAGAYPPQPQPEDGATMAPMLEKAHGRIDWTQPARVVHDLVRGMNPWPGGHTTLAGKTIRVHASRIADPGATPAAAGQVFLADKQGVFVATGAGTVELVTVQPEGKRAMSAAEWVNGRGVKAGDSFQ